MTPNLASQQIPRPGLRPSAAERRRSPSAFRGSLERRLPQTALVAEAECLLPPVGRSEAFAEDLCDEPGAAVAPTAPSGAGRGPRLRWLGLPVLALGVGATLSLVSFRGIAGLVGF